MVNTKTITVNRKAYHNYDILETLEAGIVLTGTEIKSLRAGMITIRDAYAKPDGSELWLFNSYIAAYQAGSYYNHETNRPRKLLLHRRQIDQLAGMTTQKGLTLVPLKIYIKRGVAKLELGMARGRKSYDKRDSIARRETDRVIERELKRRNR